MPARARARTPGKTSETCSMRPRVVLADATVTRTSEGNARMERARARARWAHAQSKSKNLAAAFEVTPGRVRHWATDDPTGDPLTLVCAAAAHPDCDGDAILEAIEESTEDRYADVHPKVLRARLRHLQTEAEHAAQAQQDRALMLGGRGTNDALRKHARILREIAAIRTRLGLEETAH